MHTRWKSTRKLFLRSIQLEIARKKRRRVSARLALKNRVKPLKDHEWQIVRGDMVEVVRGRDEGRQGKVIRVWRRGMAAVVDGCNLRISKTKNDAGETVTEFRPSRILIRNLALIDPDTNLPTKLDYKFQQTAIDTERYQRVRQSVIGGELIHTPKEAKPQRKTREPHPTKDTPPKLANIRTWVGPWEFFTDEQKEFIHEDSQSKIDLPNLKSKLPELIYNNVDEVREYIRMLPYCPHTFFKPGTCPPFMYQKPWIKKWSNRKMKREQKLPDGKRVLFRDDIKEQIDIYKRGTYPIYLSTPIDSNHHWPRVKPEIDPKFKQFHSYLREHCEEDEVMRILNEEATHDLYDAEESEKEEANEDEIQKQAKAY
mmetsp:Transcript_2829/g.5307  ORF Transcript_2829/g.5307 Transcript_2829/m.5307 type:complete len:370 (-) Transcript_2829:796-1905(-)|eukprot:CAMPEP_0202699956 /NCGR_PEP_ID=MMETSP1385-20130828/13176_1 /ASSEMBLY_ACC=CAM_ASM_000861 /TAXON_ID=933848 /ORGANISM="Elphidium margaritaceum" /LENGTH=369 /DNA_ID=CAMNT_0049357045 /DNA_START=34 /DNA_END=1143 /DNA_ORIENTATION=-